MRELGLGSEMKFVKISLDQIVIHPKNEEFFPTKPRTAHEESELDELKEDIRVRGVQNPVVINWKTKHIISGHRRYKVLKELGFEETLCSVIDIPEDDELEWMLADNTERREVDSFLKMKIIPYLQERRAWKTGKGKKDDNKAEAELSPRDYIARAINKNKDFVTMANIFETLSVERQKEIQDWFYKEQNGNVADKSLRDKVREAAGKNSVVVLSQKEVDQVNKWGESDQVIKKSNDIEKKVKELDGRLAAREANREARKLYTSYLEPLLDINPNEESLKDMKKDIHEIYGMFSPFLVKYKGKYNILKQ